MNLKSLWSTLEESFDILGGYGFPAMDKTATELALEPGWFTWVAAIWLFGSEPFTTAQFMRMFPYGLARLNEERFASAVRQGCLISDGQGGYFPTESGLDAANKIWRAAGDSLTGLPSPSEVNLPMLLSYLHRIADAALAAPEPPSHFFLAHKRENYKRFGTKYPLEDFVVRFGELSAYRDDMYVSTWEAHGIQGHAWEAFDQLHHGGALAFDDLYAKLNRRGIPQEIHVEDVKELVRRGWVEEGSSVYQITSAGKQVRAEVEAETERLFFLPWSCLGEAELDDLSNLATQLRDGLK